MSCFRPYTVWNARIQAFTKKFGITNTQLLQLFNASREGSNFFRSSVEIQLFSPPRAEERSLERSRFLRGNFDPYFYPGCYSVKDDLYEQYPSILTKLLTHVLEEYDAAGVGYVEFSIGVGDAKRPIIWHYITEALDSGDWVNPENGRVIKVNFLAGFGRRLSLPESDPLSDTTLNFFVLENIPN